MNSIFLAVGEVILPEVETETDIVSIASSLHFVSGWLFTVINIIAGVMIVAGVIKFVACMAFYEPGNSLMSSIMAIVMGCSLFIFGFMMQSSSSNSDWNVQAHEVLPDFSVEELKEMGLESKVGEGVVETLWTSCDDKNMKRGIELDGRAALPLSEVSCDVDSSISK